MTYHGKHCMMDGRSIHSAHAANVAAQPLLGSEEFAAARAVHRARNRAVHRWFATSSAPASSSPSGVDPVFEMDPWANYLTATQRPRRLVQVAPANPPISTLRRRTLRVVVARLPPLNQLLRRLCGALLLRLPVEMLSKDLESTVACRRIQQRSYLELVRFSLSLATSPMLPTLPGKSGSAWYALRMDSFRRW
mmetsp:Transcript_45151/g.144149  ORF Transcript_45151/g.144149 Transcript_45151/m.144149 type:complete len:193 (-) Transcript_45151:628-1206(-)